MAIKQRMRAVIATATTDRSRYVELAEKTGISTNVWKNFWFDRREPDAQMVERLCQAWPQYALWITTGVSDRENGHYAPVGAATDESQPRFEDRVIETAQALWGNDTAKMANATSIDQATWDALLERKLEPTLEIVRALAHHGSKYTLWMLKGSADTYLQLSPRDAWQHKLARALGGDPELEPDQWQAKVARVLGGKTAKSK